MVTYNARAFLLTGESFTIFQSCIIVCTFSVPWASIFICNLKQEVEHPTIGDLKFFPHPDSTHEINSPEATKENSNSFKNSEIREETRQSITLIVPRKKATSILRSALDVIKAICMDSHSTLRLYTLIKWLAKAKDSVWLVTRDPKTRQEVDIQTHTLSWNESKRGIYQRWSSLDHNQLQPYNSNTAVYNSD